MVCFCKRQMKSQKKGDRERATKNGSLFATVAIHLCANENNVICTQETRHRACERERRKRTNHSAKAKALKWLCLAVKCKITKCLIILPSLCSSYDAFSLPFSSLFFSCIYNSSIFLTFLLVRFFTASPSSTMFLSFFYSFPFFDLFLFVFSIRCNIFCIHFRFTLFYDSILSLHFCHFVHCFFSFTTRRERRRWKTWKR